MAILDIRIAPDDILRQKALPLECVDDALRARLDDMLETMYAAPGIGLAGNQVGDLRRLVTIDTSPPDEPKNPLFFINPEITWQSEDISVYNEGCLSLPEMFAEIERPAQCRVRFIDYHGVEQEMLCEGMLATCIQHEIDHLNGILFIDHLSRLKREMLLKKFTKMQKKA